MEIEVVCSSRTASMSSLFSKQLKEQSAASQRDQSGFTFLESDQYKMDANWLLLDGLLCSTK